MMNFFRRFNESFLIVLSALFILNLAISLSYAITKFGQNDQDDEVPVSFEFDAIWFYGSDMSRVIPEVDLNWVTVVFRPDLFAYAFDSTEDSALDEIMIATAKTTVSGFDEIVDLFYDPNLAEGACFLKLRDGIQESEVKNLLLKLNKHEEISYAHPTLKIEDKTYAFFNAFEIEWKTGVEANLQERLMNQANVYIDKEEFAYRVNLFETSFFKAINLLAEDIHISRVVPYLVELKPAIRASLTVAMNGGNIGDKIPFLLHISFSDLVRIDPSSLVNIYLKPPNIQKELFELKFDPYDYVEAAAKSPIRITGWMRFFTTGEFIIPSLEIKYTCSTSFDERPRVAKTKSFPFKVSSIIPDQITEKKLLIPMDLLKLNYGIKTYYKKAKMYLFFAILSFTLAFLLMGWFIAWVYLLKKQKDKLREKKEEDIVAEQIRLMLQRDPSTPHWGYIGQMSRLLRDYLVAKYRPTDYPSGGSGKVFYEAVKQSLPDKIAPAILSLFNQIDNLVALEIDPFPQMDDLKSEVLKIINA